MQLLLEQKVTSPAAVPANATGKATFPVTLTTFGNLETTFPILAIFNPLAARPEPTPTGKANNNASENDLNTGSSLNLLNCDFV